MSSALNLKFSVEVYNYLFYYEHSKTHNELHLKKKKDCPLIHMFCATTLHVQKDRSKPYYAS